MMYGAGLPLLFPLTLFSVVLQYLVEKLVTVYYYRKSPMLDEKINHNAYTTLKWAVHVYTFTGYWMLSNKQIFGNDVTPVARRDELEVTNHSLLNVPRDHAYPLLVFAILILCAQLVQEVFILVGRLVLRKDVDDYLSEEKLLPFPESLYEHDSHAAVEEETDTRERLGYRKLSERLFDRLREGKDQFQKLSPAEFKELQPKLILNSFSYNKLANRRYAEQFAYTTVVHREGPPEDHELSDRCKRHVDHAYSCRSPGRGGKDLAKAEEFKY